MTCRKRKATVDTIAKLKKTEYSPSFEIRKSLIKQSSELNKVWNDPREMSDHGFNVYKDLFTCATVDDFIDDSDGALRKLKSVVLNFELERKKNDLFHFYQSQDLRNLQLVPEISHFMNFLVQEGRKWLHDVTGFEFTEEVSATVSCYTKKDFLLCHDDRCENRKIAFVLYLNEDWCCEDGGTLQLFKADDSGEPSEKWESIEPKYNKFVFFEVNEYSFHQVQEVLTADKARITINGWFHSNMQIWPKNHELLQDIWYLPLKRPLSLSEEIVKTKINDTYLREDVQLEARSAFMKDREICLTNFFLQDYYKKVEIELTNQSIEWKHFGPLSKRSFYQGLLMDDSHSGIVGEFIEFMYSEQFIKLLSKIVNIRLKQSKKKLKSGGNKNVQVKSCEFTIQEWKAGCYTLFHKPSINEDTIEVVIFFNHTDNNSEDTGSLTYIRNNGEAEPLAVLGQQNAISIIYRDKDMLQSMNYISYSYERKFQTISLRYHFV